MSGVWTRHAGVTLRHLDGPPREGPDAALARALLDGVDGGHEEAPDRSASCATVDAEWFALHADGETVGLLALQRDRPVRDAATVLAVAVAPERRGRDYGTRALLAAERRLRRDGVEQLYARVPRSNGRGLYFVLRAGYAPVRPPVDDGATWFRRFQRAPDRATRSARGRRR